MLNVFFTSSLAFLITFLTIPAIIIIAEQKKLYDIPDARKLHTKPIASLGGVGIFGGFFFINAPARLHQGLSRVSIFLCSSHGHFFFLVSRMIS